MAGGVYYEKQIDCPSAVISWSHKARFETARRLIGDGRFTKLLDYGCGDGTFLASVADRVREALGAEIADDLIQDCRIRLARIANLRFCHVSDLSDSLHDGGYDVVTCMETLEHCTDPAVTRVLADLTRLCATTGRVIISVPIETGPSFLLKLAVRSVAAWRGLSDYCYYERYHVRDALRMITARSKTRVARPVYGPAGAEFHSHYGFNWRQLRERVRTVLHVERTCFSPLAWLGGIASSQAWFVCRLRSAK